MASQRLFNRFFLSIFLALSVPVWAWVPTHKVETRRGTLLLRPAGPNSILFRFQLAGSSAFGMVDDSLLWSPEFVNQISGTTQVEELQLGRALPLEGGASVYSFLEPVSGRLTLEVRYREADQTASRSVSLEVRRAAKPYSRTMVIKAPFAEHLYGLGEQFPENDLGETVADWKGKIRHSGSYPDSFEKNPIGVYGNSLTHLAGGNVANALFPVLYLVDERGGDAVLFLDNPIDSHWDFRRKPWTVSLRRGEVSGALAWGGEVEELRREYMRWTGHAPVPPRKAFGMWVSEYGFENWGELEEKASSLRENGFPVDGFVLDLQWFGGILKGSPDSRMGSLTFDLENFPNPAQKIAQLARRGLGVIVIEESYIAQNLPEFQELARQNFLVTSPEEPGEPHIIDRVPWWGVGSMIDYTDPEAGEYWHNSKRQPLVDMGIVGHWTDLGEPEVLRHVVKEGGKKSVYSTPLYHGDKDQLEVNNLFGLSWARSIFRGYGQDGHRAGPRPFILARTGTSGIQRYGASLWSGDIASNWKSLRSHYVAQSHMSFSGIDYYGSDVGGFFRNAYQGEPGGMEELYTRGFAAACLTDIPLRPHTMNLGNKYETAPDRIGDRQSNLNNLRLRYRLIPYLYSAAHQAWKEGRPVISPVVMRETVDRALARSATAKMVGPYLLAHLVLEQGSREMECLLPQGRWYDFYSGSRVKEGEAGAVTSPTRGPDGSFLTPLFARAGALVVLGPAETSKPDYGRLEMAVFPGEREESTQVYYDDGESESYRGGDFAVTTVRQSAWRGRYGSVTVEPMIGPFAAKMPARRDVVLRVAYSGERLQATVDNEIVDCRPSGGYWVVTLPQVPVGRSTVVSFR